MKKHIRIKPLLSYALYTTNIKIDKDKIYSAVIATNQPDYEKLGLVFCNEILLNKDEYIIIKPTPTIDKIITDVSSKFGAPMGRFNTQNTRPENKKVYDCYVPMSCCGSYDKGGAYWGLGEPLRVSYTKDLSYVEFYRVNNN